MLRRVLTHSLAAGDRPLASSAAHHVRDVLRLGCGDALELFDAGGATAHGQIIACGPEGVVVRVGEVRPADASGFSWVIVSAVPKAARADWMVEKLSELGAAAFVPLAAERSVALPEGKGKRERWGRLAAEAARQSRRAGVMRIGELTTVDQWIAGRPRRESSDAQPPALSLDPADTFDGTPDEAWYLSTEPGATPITAMAATLAPHHAGTTGPSGLSVLVGPEGGWTDGEIAHFREAGLTAVGLTATILRVETAALAAAAVIASIIAPLRAASRPPPAGDSTEDRLGA